ncbi:signal peptidase I [Leptospira adleri]|uniref:Signal peptidase I n=1 Tax=Leptospira adleri TaxID=2023186 RepID=A0A2M9YNK0_9LEPT|nr:signal peptidase I [Leptospira adleri]PJZ53114.1 signal peptidase I [Leptospira adleri]PJZ62097.1 signal peptidase I [Leptospira adleri]
MKRKIVGIFLNLIFPPFGFYYLRDRFLFWIFYGYSLFAGLLVSVFTYILFENRSGKAALFFLIICLLSNWGILIFATLASEAKTKTSAFRRFPSPYWFLPVSVLFLLFFGIAVDELLKDRILKGKVQLSSGMVPSINVNDTFYITELFYKKELKRGDIVAYQNEKAGRQSLGRIVGLPGETILISEEITSDGFSVTRIFVNGEKVPQERSDKKATNFHSGLDAQERIVLLEALGDRLVPVLESKSDSGIVLFPKVKLAEDELFLLGDNRDGSIDSRMLGPVGFDRLIGKFAFTYLSSNQDRVPSKICNGDSDYFCTIKRFYKIIILGNVRWGYLGFDNSR